MEARVDGKVALVTGATQGIGRAIAETLARSGCAGLLLTGRNTARGEAVAAEMASLGTPARFVTGDLGDPALPPLLVETCLQAFGRIDALVNVAALTDRASFLDADPALWDQLFSVNARAPFFLMQGAIRAMRDRGQGGAIVNILSVNTHCGTPDLAVGLIASGASAGGRPGPAPAPSSSPLAGPSWRRLARSGKLLSYHPPETGREADRPPTREKGDNAKRGT